MSGLAAVFAELRKAIRAAGGQSAWAAEHGLSASYVSDVLNARREPGPAILAAIGFERRLIYRRKKAS
jgi:DNA-binding transcriptional regulator YdaS (Cro superfamily)